VLMPIGLQRSRLWLMTALAATAGGFGANSHATAHGTAGIAPMARTARTIFGAKVLLTLAQTHAQGGPGIDPRAAASRKMMKMFKLAN